MIKPDHETKGYKLVSFSGREFRDVMVKFLNWLEQPNAKVVHATSGDFHYSNDFYVLHESTQIEYDNEFSDYCVTILCGDETHE